MRTNINIQDAAKNLDVLASRIGLFLDTGKSCVITEGPTDQKFYKRFVAETKSQVFCPDPNGRANGKEPVLELLKLLETRKLKGILAIVDADFDRLEGTKPSSSNLLFIDTHDLETLLLKSPALEKILDEHASEEKRKNFGEDRIRSTLLEGGVLVGYLRWASLKHSYSLTFEGLDFKRFTSESTLAITLSQLVTTVKQKSQKLALKDEDIMAKMDELKSDSHDKWDVCCGHDLVEILSFGLRKTLGTNDSKKVECEILESLLRVGYEAAYFVETDLYQAIHAWEANNKPFKVLP
jgi:hypothetical protein